MTSRISEFLARRRGKEWAVLAILAIALTVEALDAGFGLRALGAESRLAPESLTEIANVTIVVAAVWLIRL